MNKQEQLLDFARTTAYPYLLSLDIIKKSLSDISIILVGSVATGLCDENSDVDICILCRKETFDRISAGTMWAEGRPIEITLNDIQIHYYAISLERVLERLAAFEDLAFYVYGTALPLNDHSNLFHVLQDAAGSEDSFAKRRTKAIDMLVHRRQALGDVLSTSGDPIVRMEICLELIRLIVQTTALSDNIQFDPRKRLYKTALQGRTGRMNDVLISRMITLVSDISNKENASARDSILESADQCIANILGSSTNDVNGGKGTRENTDYGI